MGVFKLASGARVYTTRDCLPKRRRGLGTVPQQVPTIENPFSYSAGEFCHTENITGSAAEKHHRHAQAATGARNDPHPVKCTLKAQNAPRGLKWGAVRLYLFIRFRMNG